MGCSEVCMCQTWWREPKDFPYETGGMIHSPSRCVPVEDVRREQELEELRQEVLRLKEGVKKYGWHTPGCMAYGKGKCFCGFGALLQEIRGDR